MVYIDFNGPGRSSACDCVRENTICSGLHHSPTEIPKVAKRYGYVPLYMAVVARCYGYVPLYMAVVARCYGYVPLYMAVVARCTLKIIRIILSHVVL